MGFHLGYPHRDIDDEPLGYPPHPSPLGLLSREVRKVSGFIFLSSPYSSPDPFVRAQRYKAAARATIALMEAGEVVFSPIVHGHAIETVAKREFPHEDWIRLSRTLLAGASYLYVLTLEGWEVSKGILEEVRLAYSLNIPVVGYAHGPDCEDINGFTILTTCGLKPSRRPFPVARG